MGTQRTLSKLWRRSESGATAVEYALLLGLMVLAIVGAITATGQVTQNNMQKAADSYPEDAS